MSEREREEGGEGGGAGYIHTYIYSGGRKKANSNREEGREKTSTERGGKNNLKTREYTNNKSEQVTPDEMK